MTGVNLKDANLRRASLSWANLYRADLTGADLDEAVLIDTNFREASLLGVDLRKAYLFYIKDSLPEYDRWALDIEDNLKKSFEGADLTGADLRGAKLMGADLTEADLDSSVWNKEDVRDVRSQILNGNFECILVSEGNELRAIPEYKILINKI